MRIRFQQPIPGVPYSQYEVSASGDNEEELSSNFKVAEKTILSKLESQKLVCNKETLARFLKEKSITQDFINWLKTNGKT